MIIAIILTILLLILSGLFLALAIVMGRMLSEMADESYWTERKWLRK